MTSIISFSLRILRSLLILVVSYILFFGSFTQPCLGQNKLTDVEMSFVKSNDSIKANDLYFNVLKIWNNTSTAIVGNLSFSVPEDWKTITFPTSQLQLMPNDTVLVPLRVSPVSNALGGIAYIINASFRTSNQQISASTYLTLPSVAKWDFSINKSNAYFTDASPTTTFQIRLSNKGNTNELIKLNLSAGKMLSFANNLPNSSIEYVNLKAFADTTIVHTLTSQTNISFADKIRYENNWKESAIHVTASTEKSVKGSSLQIYKLNSNYSNHRLQTASPLNIDYQVYNIMSNNAARHNLKLYGSLLLSNNREIQYVTGIQNFGLGNTTDEFDINRQLLYTIRYTDNRNNVQLGYNISSGTLHSINGRGITGVFNIDKRNSISYGLTQNPYSQTIGEFLGCTKSFKRFSINAELTHDGRPDRTYEATSALIGSSYTLFKYHYFSLQLLGSKANYNKLIPQDTSVLGFSYKVSYNIQYKKFYLRFSSLNSEHNYILNSGLQQTYLDSKYQVSDNVGLTLYGNHQKYAITRYPYNFFNPVNYNTNDNLRLTTSISAGNITYQIGPNYNGSIRQSYNTLSGYKSEYTTYQPGFWGAVSIKFGGYKSITPNLTVSNIRFYYKTNDPLLENYSFDKNIYYSAGLSYFDNVWRVNAYYTSGSTTDLYRSVLVDAEPVISRSIQFRPSYENFFFNRTVKLSAYVNYAYYMPSGRENVSFNLKYDQTLKKGWNFSVSGFMYSNTRMDEEKGRISTKDLNLLIGFTKSFNIQQPRLKYYDFKTVFFNDLDGNKLKTNNEPPVTDILMSVEKDQSAQRQQSDIPEIKLITDGNGSASIENLPKDYYKLSFTPLTNLQSLYFLNGSEQTYFNDKSRTLYIPLAESYKIKGKIILVRDPNSTEGKIDLGDIRITATGQKGETVSVLTDNFGAFVLSVPNAEKFTVHINNVFGEQFNIDNNEIIVQFTQNKTINVDFTFIEKKRGIDFGADGELFKFGSLNNKQIDEVANTSLNDNMQEVETTANSYAIQLLKLDKYQDPSIIKRKFKLKEDVLYTETNGVYTYFTGNYASLKLAKLAIAKLGIAALPVVVDKTLLLTAKPVESNAVAQKESITATIQSTVPANSSFVKSKYDEKLEQKSSSISNNISQALTKNNNSVLIDTSAVAPSNYNSPNISAAIVQNSSSNQLLESPNINLVTQKDSILPANTKPILNKIIGGAISNNAADMAKQIEATTIKKAAVKSNNTLKPNLTIVDGRVVQDISTVQDELKSAVSTTVPVLIKNKSTAINEPTVLPTVKEFNVGNSSSMKQNLNHNVTLTTPNAAASNQPENLKTSISKTQLSTPAVSPIAKSGKTTIDTSVDSTSIALNTKILNPFINVKRDISKGKNYIYTIRLDASRVFREAKYYKEKYNLPLEVICIEKGGLRKYYTGKYETVEAAKADIAQYGLAGFIVSIDEIK